MGLTLPLIQVKCRGSLYPGKLLGGHEPCGLRRPTQCPTLSPFTSQRGGGTAVQKRHQPSPIRVGDVIWSSSGPKSRWLCRLLWAQGIRGVCSVSAAHHCVRKNTVFSLCREARHRRTCLCVPEGERPEGKGPHVSPWIHPQLCLSAPGARGTPSRDEGEWEVLSRPQKPRSSPWGAWTEGEETSWGWGGAPCLE